MAKFKSKVIEIEAMQYTLETRDEVIAWCGAQHKGIDDDGAEIELKNLRIHTLEGVMMVCPGDWIIKGTEGEFYPCKPSVFERKYESVEDTKP